MRGHFSSHCTVVTGQGLKTVQFSELEPIKVQAPASNAPASKVEQALADESAGVIKTLEQDAQAADQAARINLNGTQSSISSLKYIGRSRAKEIARNRPEGGYTNFANFKALNSRLFDDEDGWQKLEADSKFE